MENPIESNPEKQTDSAENQFNPWLYIGLPVLIAAVAIVYLLVTRLQAAQSSDAQASISLPISEAYGTYPVDDFTLTSDDGSLSLYDCLDTPVVLRFFSPLEENLPEELSLMESISAEYNGKILFLPVCIPEEAEKAGAIFTENGICLPIYTDTSEKAKDACAVTQIPSTVFIDEYGFLAASSKGAIDEETLRFGISLIAP